MAPPRAGSLIGGRYSLKAPLATGGMGTVWLASHVELEIEVAVKLVSRAFARRPDLVERFRREARAAAQLKTPHVVQILDYGVDDGAPYIAMELLAGEDLDALLDRESVVSPARALAIVGPICKALSVAHAAGIVHRDLKPSNIFLSRIADEEVVKIVDFGIAKELKRGAEYATGASMLGSPLFMSPEQVAGSGDVDARTDLWSLSVLIYILILGEPPFKGEGITELLIAVTCAQFAPPSTRAATLAPLDAFFARGLARAASERFADVAELLAAFQSAVAALPDPAVIVQKSTPASSFASTGTSSPGSVAVSNIDSDSMETRALLESHSALDPDATRIASVSASTQLSFSAGASETAPEPVVSYPPRQVARPTTETASRSGIPIVIVAVIAAVAAVAVFVVTSGDDRQSGSPAAHGETIRASTERATTEATAPPAPPPPVVDPMPTSAVPPPSGAASASAARATVPGAPTRRGAPAPSAPTASAASSPSAPPKPASQPDKIDPEWGVPVLRP